MEKIGWYEAKTQFAELLKRASIGGDFILTRNGHPMAKLIPFAESGLEEGNKLVAGIRGLRRTLAAQGRVLKERESWRDLAHEGHRS